MISTNLESSSTQPPILSSTEEKSKYPIEVWAGTPYYDYAMTRAQGNYIPVEFHVECLKTLVGAIAGDRVFCKKTAIYPRFYTCLIGEPSCGKGTAIDWAVEVFQEHGLLYKTKEQPIYQHIGAVQSSFASEVGVMHGLNVCNRIIQVFGEGKALFEKMSITGSGEGLQQFNLDLYDKPFFNGTLSRHRETLPKLVFNSLLLAIQPDKWLSAFTGIGSERGGFFQRLNLVSYSKDVQTVGILPKHDLTETRDALIPRLKELEKSTVEVEITEEATKRIDEWWKDFREQHRDESDITSRLNVLAQRNALHMAWLSHGDFFAEYEKPTIDVTMMEGAIRLAEHQYIVRKQYEPIYAENRYALMENLIRSKVRAFPGITLRDLKKKVHYERTGIKTFTDAFSRVCAEGSIIPRKSKSKHGKESVALYPGSDGDIISD